MSSIFPLMKAAVNFFIPPERRRRGRPEISLDFLPLTNLQTLEDMGGKEGAAIMKRLEIQFFRQTAQDGVTKGATIVELVAQEGDADFESVVNAFSKAVEQEFRYALTCSGAFALVADTQENPLEDPGRPARAARSSIGRASVDSAGATAVHALNENAWPQLFKRAQEGLLAVAAELRNFNQGVAEALQSAEVNQGQLVDALNRQEMNSQGKEGGSSANGRTAFQIELLKEAIAQHLETKEKLEWEIDMLEKNGDETERAQVSYLRDAFVSSVLVRSSFTYSSCPAPLHWQVQEEHEASLVASPRPGSKSSRGKKESPRKEQKLPLGADGGDAKIFLEDPGDESGDDDEEEEDMMSEDGDEDLSLSSPPVAEAIREDGQQQKEKEKEKEGAGGRRRKGTRRSIHGPPEILVLAPSLQQLLQGLSGATTPEERDAILRGPEVLAPAQREAELSTRRLMDRSVFLYCTLFEILTATLSRPDSNPIQARMETVALQAQLRHLDALADALAQRDPKRADRAARFLFSDVTALSGKSPPSGASVKKVATRAEDRENMIAVNLNLSYSFSQPETLADDAARLFSGRRKTHTEGGGPRADLFVFNTERPERDSPKNLSSWKPEESLMDLRILFDK
uniref:Uncharacterized protein n=1 Tax=Chromera velia CCMP2878 TaxID=1169474 RepID=A0A0G4HR95_9ALVE|eukprot:Cvel_8034.t1-p1 / transcript=Cvel_8034.t1 / gene=Cvel_8034 / organism=Chromera_velia_CCMP2878 / gene_product=hypothetical protein / transcript_product=hypothetical protein / location=Cvel_scaffold434:38370-43167(+) / protein_length=627 / sequence_SO=supercontig / SO=protein_coding / is_pseudo=false